MAHGAKNPPIDKPKPTAVLSLYMQVPGEKNSIATRQVGDYIGTVNT